MGGDWASFGHPLVVIVLALPLFGELGEAGQTTHSEATPARSDAVQALVKEIESLERIFAKSGRSPPSVSFPSSSSDADVIKLLNAELDALEAKLSEQQRAPQPITVRNNLTVANWRPAAAPGPPLADVRSGKPTAVAPRSSAARSGDGGGPFFTVQHCFGCLLLLFIVWLAYRAWLQRHRVGRNSFFFTEKQAGWTDAVGDGLQELGGSPSPVPMEVFRMNATRDGYDYYQAMEAPEGDYEVDSVLPWTMLADRFSGRRLVVVLEKAALELANGLRDPSARVHDGENELVTTHECLLTLLDCPLNKTGRLLIYVHSAGGVLIEVHPCCRLPRLFLSFAELILELLGSGEVAGQHATFPLLKIVAGPVQHYFPPGCRSVALATSGPRFVRVRELCSELAALVAAAGRASSQAPETVVFAIGVSEEEATVEKRFGAAYCEEVISLCPFGLRSSCVCRMLCHEFENLWDVYQLGGNGISSCNATAAGGSG